MEEEDDDATPNAELPTANAIAAARMKRETMRKIGAVDGEQTSNGNGFISLDVAVAGTKKGESRLVREEDEMGEGDDGTFSPFDCEVLLMRNGRHGRLYRRIRADPPRSTSDPDPPHSAKERRPNAHR